MVIADIGEFFYALAERFFCLKLIQIGAFVFQRIEIPLHRRVIIWLSRLTHALRHMDGFAEFHICLWCILGTLITVQDQFPFQCRLWIQRFLQCTDCKVTGDLAVRDTGNNTPVMQFKDGAVISYFMIRKEQISKICTPFLIYFVCGEVLIQLIFKCLVRLPMFIIRFFGRTIECSPSSVFIYLCMAVKL